MIRFPAWSFVVIGLVIAVGTGVRLQTRQPQSTEVVIAKSGLSITPTSVDAGVVQVGQPTVVRFVVTNSHNQPLQLLGGNGQCNSTGCVNWETHLPLTIPAGDQLEIVAELRPATVGTYTGELKLFMEGSTIEVIKLQIKAEAVQ